MWVFPVLEKSMKRLTIDEQRAVSAAAVRNGHRGSSSYPRWRRCSIGGFLLWISPNDWVEEVFHRFDGSWVVGRKGDGTVRVFSELHDALIYGELLYARNFLAEAESQFNPRSGRELLRGEHPAMGFLKQQSE